jgi:hypothetical protein
MGTMNGISDLYEDVFGRTVPLLIESMLPDLLKHSLECPASVPAFVSRHHKCAKPHQ